jgi:hypothetical protein
MGPKCGKGSIFIYFMRASAARAAISRLRAFSSVFTGFTLADLPGPLRKWVE